jgi:hypothetical protein
LFCVIKKLFLVCACTHLVEGCFFGAPFGENC